MFKDNGLGFRVFERPIFLIGDWGPFGVSSNFLILEMGDLRLSS